MKIPHIFLSIALASTSVALPAFAESDHGRPEWMQKHDRHDDHRDDRRDDRKYDHRDDHKGDRRDDHRDHARDDHRDDRGPRPGDRRPEPGRAPEWAGHCPPGLAKKNPPCVPPGQAKAYDRDDAHDHGPSHDRLPPREWSRDVPRAPFGLTPTGDRDRIEARNESERIDRLKDKLAAERDRNEALTKQLRIERQSVGQQLRREYYQQIADPARYNLTPSNDWSYYQQNNQVYQVNNKTQQIMSIMSLMGMLPR